MQSGLKREEIYGLFSSNFSNKVKNYQLAKKALKHLNKKIHLIELVGYNRDEVNILLNAVDFLLMTSISEGSPQIIKEAMACNCPIITTDVGDVTVARRSSGGAFSPTHGYTHGGYDGFSDV